MPDTIYYGRDAEGTSVDETGYQELAQQNTLVDLNITYITASTGETAYQMKANPNLAVGQDNLIQRVVKSILTVRGSNAYDPSVGSYFTGLRSALSPDEISDIKTKFPLYLNSVANTLISADAELLAQGQTIAPEERLQELILESVEYDETFSGWLIAVKIQTAANTSFVVNLP